MQGIIEWTPAKLQRFRTVLNNHHSDAPFRFDGYWFVPKYAKYLIEYLKGVFNETDDQTTDRPQRRS